MWRLVWSIQLIVNTKRGTEIYQFVSQSNKNKIKKLWKVSLVLQRITLHAIVSITSYWMKLAAMKTLQWWKQEFVAICMKCVINAARVVERALLLSLLNAINAFIIVSMFCNVRVDEWHTNLWFYMRRILCNYTIHLHKILRNKHK